MLAFTKSYLEECKKEMFLGNPFWANKSAEKAQTVADSVVTLKGILEGNEDYSVKLIVLGENGFISNPQYYVDETQKNADEARRIADGGEFDYDEQKALEQAVKEAEQKRDEAREEKEKANALEAQEKADEAQEKANQANEIADEIGNESAQEKAQEAQDAADEAQEAADAAQELEEMIREMFEEEGLPEEEYEDFKQGVLDELFGEEEGQDEMEDEFPSQTKQKYGRKYVNWKTGETTYYGESDPITKEWVEVTPFFSGIYQNGREVVVERTLDGAIQLLSALGISVSNRTKTEFKIVNPTDQAINLLREMRMFIVSDDSVSY
jgi:hypothetical protein